MRTIKFFPGDIIQISKTNWLITSVSNGAHGALYYYALRLDNDDDIKITITQLNDSWIDRSVLVYRMIGEVFDDYYCHENRCKPKSLAGCKDCEFKNKKPSKLFYPNDIIYAKDIKMYLKITNMILVINGVKFDKDGWNYYHDYLNTPVDFPLNVENLISMKESGALIKINYTAIVKTSSGFWSSHEKKIDNTCNCNRYNRSTVYKSEELRSHICNNLCIFSKGSENCFDCIMEDE